MSRSWLKVPARWRRSRGFGIHSPFAYDLIVNTLRERRCRYYLYAGIESQYKADSKILKLILRLVSRLRPASVSAVGSLADVVTAIARHADSAVITDSPGCPDMLVVTPGAADPSMPSLVGETLAAGGTVILTDRRLYADLSAIALGQSMTFSNGRVLIAAGRRDLPRQHFDLYF